MSYNVKQFRDLIIRVLAEFDPILLSDSAVALLLGTAAQESRLGTYMTQVGGGPALGAFQMEPGTFLWLRDVYGEKYHAIAGRLPSELEWDLRLSVVMARLRYRVVRRPLPEADDVVGLARYWKEYYNTSAGAGRIDDFVSNFRRYVLDG